MISNLSALRDEIDREFAKALQSGKKKRKKQQDGEDLETSIDDDLILLRERMKDAAKQDADANEEKRAATNKINMLTEVTTILTKYAVKKNHKSERLLSNILL